MKSLEFKDMTFTLTDEGSQTEYIPMTMSLTGEATQFNLLHKAEDSSHFIVSDSYFVDEQANLSLLNTEGERSLSNFRRSIDAKFDLNFGGRSSSTSDVRIIGNNKSRTSLLDITFIEISDEQYVLWSKACKENKLNRYEWTAINNKFPNTGHCSLVVWGRDNTVGDFAHIGAYIPTRVFETMWSEIQSKNINSVFAAFRFWCFTNRSRYGDSSLESSHTYFLPPRDGGYGEDEAFVFESSAYVGGALTDLSFSQKIDK